MYRESFTVVAQLPALTDICTVRASQLQACSTAGKFTELTIICTVIASQLQYRWTVSSGRKYSMSTLKVSQLKHSLDRFKNLQVMFIATFAFAVLPGQFPALTIICAVL
jgi:hypothetical protein